MNNQLTASYTMINKATGQEQSYFVAKKENNIYPLSVLSERAINQLRNFPAYQSGLMKLKDNTIYVTNYKRQAVAELNIF